MPINQALATCGIITATGLNAFAHEGLIDVADFAELNENGICWEPFSLGTHHSFGFKTDQ